ncbi:MAG: DUF6502 family protein [Chromatocurvus sp.]
MMTETVQQALRSAILRLLQPLVHVLLRHGMAYGTFAELARKAYVEAGFSHIADSGRRATISNVSALTGLTRKETKRLLELNIASEHDSEQRYNRAIRVVSGWLADPRFHNSEGEPAELPLEGENSFATLVKDYSGDIPPAAMLGVLETSHTVGRDADHVRLEERAYMPSHTPVERIHILGRDPGELISTISHNLAATRSTRVFQRKLSNPAVREDALAAFRELTNRKSQELLEEYHRWLSAHEVDAEEPETGKPHYVAVGIYYFDDTLNKDTPE